MARQPQNRWTRFVKVSVLIVHVHSHWLRTPIHVDVYYLIVCLYPPYPLCIRDVTCILYISVVQRYEQTFEKFRQETENAIATFRKQFSDIRRKFEMLKRIRQSLMLELVQPRPSSNATAAAASAVRHVVGGIANAAAGGAAVQASASASGVRRKRWGKKTSMRRRLDHSCGGGGGTSRF